LLRRYSLLLRLFQLPLRNRRPRSARSGQSLHHCPGTVWRKH